MSRVSGRLKLRQHRTAALAHRGISRIFAHVNGVIPAAFAFCAFGRVDLNGEVAFGKFDVRKRLVIEGSRAFNVSYVYANLLGNEAGRVIYDGGALIASAGTLLAAGPRFSFAPVGLTTAMVDVHCIAKAKKIISASAPPSVMS